MLVRHAEPAESARGRCYGSLDVGLSDGGRRQCETLADRLREESVTAIVSSPRLRALETARPIAGASGLEVLVADELRELDFGVLEGRTYDEIARTMPELFARWMSEPTAVRFPGGEGYGDLRARALRWLGGLEARTDGVVVAVTHGGVVRCLVAELLGIPDGRIFRLGVDTASLTRVRWIEGEPVVVGLNERAG